MLVHVEGDENLLRPLVLFFDRQVREFREKTGDGRGQDLRVDHRLRFRKQRFQIAEFAGESRIALVELRLGDPVLYAEIDQAFALCADAL